MAVTDTSGGVMGLTDAKHTAINTKITADKVLIQADVSTSEDAVQGHILTTRGLIHTAIDDARTDSVAYLTTQIDADETLINTTLGT